MPRICAATNNETSDARHSVILRTRASRGEEGSRTASQQRSRFRFRHRAALLMCGATNNRAAVVLHPNPPPIWEEGIRARRGLQNFLSLARMRGAKVETGEFGATMDVELVN